MKGIVNWYSDRKKKGLIEGQDGKTVMVYEKDIPFLTLLHAGDFVEYIVKNSVNEIRAVNIKKISK